MTAATIVSEVGTLRRFGSARQLMGFAGLVPREHSSGTGTHRAAITKTGNAHLRRVLVDRLLAELEAQAARIGLRAHTYLAKSPPTTKPSLGEVHEWVI